MAEDYKQFLDRVKSALETDDSDFSKSCKDEFLAMMDEFNQENGHSKYDIMSIQPLLSVGLSMQLCEYCRKITSQYPNSILSESVISDLADNHLDELIDLFQPYTFKELYHGLHYLEDSSIRRIVYEVFNTHFEDAYYSVISNDFNTFISLARNIDIIEFSKIFISEFVKSDVFVLWLTKYLTVSNGNPDVIETFYSVSPNVISFMDFIQKVDGSNLTKEILNEIYTRQEDALYEIRQRVNYYKSKESIPKYTKRKLNELVNHYDFLFDCSQKTGYFETPDSVDIIIRLLICHIKKIFDEIKLPLQVDNISNQVHNNIKSSENQISEDEFAKFINENFEIIDSERKRFDLNYKGNLLSFINSSNDIKTFETFCFILFPNYTVKGSGVDYFKGRIKHLQGKFTWINEPINNMDCAKRICKYFPKFNDCIKDKEKFTYNQNKLKGIIAKLVVEDGIDWIESFIDNYWAIQSGYDGKKIDDDPRRDFLYEINLRRKDKKI